MGLRYCYEPNQSEKDLMYENYAKRALYNGISPVGKDKTMFLTSGVSCRDEDDDILEADVREEATEFFSSVRQENKNVEILLLQIGFNQNVEVYGEKPKAPKTCADGDGRGM